MGKPPFNLIFDFIVGGIFSIVYSSLMFLSAREKETEAKLTSLLKISSLLNVLLIILSPLFIDFIIPNFPWFQDVEVKFFVISLVRVVFLSLPQIFLVGVSFIIYGNANRELYGDYLTIHGISRTCALSWTVVNNLLIVSYPTYTDILLFVYIIGYAMTALNLLAAIMMIVHGTKNNDRYLLIGGTVLLIIFITSFLYYRVLLPIISNI